MTTPTILVVGSMNMDLITYGVPRSAEYGESLFCQNYATVPGGKGANQAVAAVRMGGLAYMVGCTGDDENGNILLANLRHHGVVTDDVNVLATNQTGLANILVDAATGKYKCYLVMGGNDCITPAQVEAALNRRNYDMVLMQLEMPMETVYRTYELAAEREIPVFLDAGPAMAISLKKLRGLFVISPNEAETKALVGIDPNTDIQAEKAAIKIYEIASPKYVLLKLGIRGALIYDGKTAEIIPCFTELKAVDSTAAGDVFGAAFAVHYCMNADVRAAIRYAHAAAGICVSRKGAQDSIPSADEVNDFLEKGYYG